MSSQKQINRLEVFGLGDIGSNNFGEASGLGDVVAGNNINGENSATNISFNMTTSENTSIGNFSTANDLSTIVSGYNNSLSDIDAVGKGIVNALSQSSELNISTYATEDDYGIGDDGVQESLDNIFAAVIVGGIKKTDIELAKRKAEVFKQCLNLFRSIYTRNIFRDEYAVLYEVIKTLQVKVFKWSQLETIMDNSADDILNSERIDLSKYAYTVNGGQSTNEEKMMALKLDVRDKFISLSNRFVSIDEFESACEIYNAYFKESNMADIAQSMAMITSIGKYEKVGGGRTKLWKGADDCRIYYNKRIAEINSIDETQKVDETVIDDEWLADDDAGEDGDEVILYTRLPEIDDVYLGLRRGNMFETIGPPKGGKTSFTEYLVTIGLEEGKNVAVWPLEGSKKEWISAIVSNMVYTKTHMVIDKNRVMHKKYNNDMEKQAVLAAKQELAIAQKRGRLSFISGILYCETVVDVLDNHYSTKNAFDIVVVDSPILALSLTGKTKVDRISETYVKLKNYVCNKMKRKALCLVTAQLKQNVIDEIRQHPDSEVDVTAGAESAETIRTPDFITCIISTKEERKLGHVKMCDVGTRHSESFDTFYLGAKLGCVHFYSDPELNKV